MVATGCAGCYAAAMRATDVTPGMTVRVTSSEYDGRARDTSLRVVHVGTVTGFAVRGQNERRGAATRAVETRDAIDTDRDKIVGAYIHLDKLGYDGQWRQPPTDKTRPYELRCILGPWTAADDDAFTAEAQQRAAALRDRQARLERLAAATFTA